MSYVNETRHALLGNTSSFFGSGGADATQTSHFGTIITDTVAATEAADLMLLLLYTIFCETEHLIITSDEYQRP